MRKQQSKIWWLLVVLMCLHDSDAQSDWTDKSPHKNGFITANHVKLHYLDWGGKGETLLFLHGLGDTAHIFDVLAPRFTNEFRVVGLTRRGHGESDVPDGDYDTATRVEDIRQFLDALKIRRAILAGHSVAGGELTMFGGVHPDRTIKLVYFDAVSFIYEGERLAEMPPELKPTQADIESLDSIRRWQKRMNNRWSEAWEATLRVHFSTDGKPLAIPGRSRMFELWPAGEAKTDFKRIKSPILAFAVVGPSSNTLNYVKTLPESRRKAVDDFQTALNEAKGKELDRFRNEIPGARVVAFTNVDHHCFIDREDEVLREMRTFLAK
jgi:pimeloyl-ACP methyl ester carboxylesterase